MTNPAHILDGDAASADAFVTRAREARRAVAAAQAAEAAVLAEAHGWARDVAARQKRAMSRQADLEIRDVAAQIGSAIRLSDRTVQRQMDDAVVMVDRFPATFTAWQQARIDRAHAVAIVDAGAPIVDDEARAWYERQALGRAETLTAAQLRPVVRVLADHANPETLDERHARARARRRVGVLDLDDGMARLFADLPAVLAYGVQDRLTQMAHELRAAAVAVDGDGDGDAGGGLGRHPREDGAGDGDLHDGVSHTGGAAGGEGSGDAAASGSGAGAGVITASEASRAARSGADPRTMDELRADVLADLLLAGAPAAHGDGDALAAVAAHVQVTVPVLTTLGESREPCVLAGYGPVPLEAALRLAGQASGWDRVMTHPTSGEVLAVDRYRPSEHLRRLLRVRDEHCRFPGCRIPTWRSDLDHTVDAARGGPTDARNLGHLCRRHHVLKHQTDWTVEQIGHGELRWRSPAGRAYIDKPAPTVRFVAADDPPPF